MSAHRWPQLPPVRPSLRPSVRPTSSPPPPPQPGRPGPAQRRPEQPRPREETGAAPARPCPAPSSRLSVRPSARPRFRPPVGLPALRPLSPLRPLCLSLARSLFVSALALSAPPSLRDLGSPPPALLSSLTATGSGTPILRDSSPRSFGTSPSEHAPLPRRPLSLPHIIRGSPWSLCPGFLGLASTSPRSPGGSLFSGASYICQNLLHPLRVSLNSRYLSSSPTSEPLYLDQICPLSLSSLFSERPSSPDPVPGLALPASSAHLCRWSHCSVSGADGLPLSLLLCPGILLPCFSARPPVSPSLCSLSLPLPFLSAGSLGL